MENTDLSELESVGVTLCLALTRGRTVQSAKQLRHIVNDLQPGELIEHYKSSWKLIFDRFLYGHGSINEFGDLGRRSTRKF